MQLSKAPSAFQRVQRFGRAMLVVFGLAFVIAFLTSMHSRPAVASSSGSPTVTVANTPLPVTGNINATISGPIAISGNSSVNAAQSGAWTVGISGTPTVNLGNTGTLPVTDSGDPAASGFTPVQLGASCGFTGEGCETQIDNPASTGQLLVVEYLGAQVVIGSGQKLSRMSVTGILPGLGPFTGDGLQVWMPTYQADDGTHAIFGASQTVRLYYPAGVEIALTCQMSSSTDTGNCAFAATGYLVNVH